MSDQAEGAAAPEGGAGAGEGGGEGGNGGGGLDKLMSAFEGFKGDVTGRLDALQQRIPEPAADEGDDDGEFDPFEFEFGDDDYGDDGALTQEAQFKALQQMMRQVAREEQRPHLEREQVQRRMQEADALEERYPKLQDDKFQDEMIAKTVAFARDMGAPALAQEPKLLEMVYLAHEAQQRAGDEIPAGGEREVVLERSAAAGGGGGSKDDDGDRIVSAARGGQFRLGSG